jgi:hypothetical protein
MMAAIWAKGLESTLSSVMLTVLLGLMVTDR